MTTIEWTKKGYRIYQDRYPTLVVLTVETQRWLGAEKGDPVRQPWILSKLGLPDGTAMDEAVRVVEHWLSFYGDDELTERGVQSVVEFFETIPLKAGEPGVANPDAPLGGAKRKLN